jgi:beta-galactosidase
MKLGVCYYPEHWPQNVWVDDARAMRKMGIEQVRLAEFAWSRIEPEPGQLSWAWLDRAVEVLHGAGLKLVMCTPTATPPKWLVDAHPEVLAVDAQGQRRGFGSRRHYCFSSAVYREQAVRICRLMAERYGQHPAVLAWQTDNEYGCHDTVLSYSSAAVQGFRTWLQRRYGDVAALNQAWGTVFWAQEYRSFDEIDAPVGTVTEAHPAHRLDYQRFASDEVVAFNRLQCDVLRELSPGRDVLHNFMGFFTGFDHHQVAQDLDVSTWDSYPLGFTQDFFLSEEEKVRYARTGHPDIPAFHHDLYRGMCKGRWWVMEQQPGPVNWASWNPAPADGMVRLWTWQAFAHGAEVVSYFRWRQAPFAQEQMHTGLHRPDHSVDQGGIEATQVGLELSELRATAGAALQAASFAPSVAKVALVFDYTSLWMAKIQPQGADYDALALSFRVYSSLRQLGLDVDVIAAAELSNIAKKSYRLIVLPALLRTDTAWVAGLQALESPAQIVLGPRTGSKSEAMGIPTALPPGDFAALAGVKVLRVASLPAGLTEPIEVLESPPVAASASSGPPRGQVCLGSGSVPKQVLSMHRWREDLELQAPGVKTLAAFSDGRPAITQHGQTRYVAGCLNDAGWLHVLRQAALEASLEPQEAARDLRVSRLGCLTVVCNFADSTVEFSAPPSARCLVGGEQVAPRGISVWESKASSERVD